MLTEKEWETLWNLLDRIGDSTQGTWQDRMKELLSRATADAGSGTEEVFGWLGIDLD